MVSFKKVSTVSMLQIDHLSVANIAQMSMFYIKLTSLKDFYLEEVPVSPTRLFKQSLDSFYVTDSYLNVTNIAQKAMFYLY